MRVLLTRHICLAAVFAALVVARDASAQRFFEQSPGPLSASHESLSGQDQCTKCHTSGKELSTEKCIGCHKPVKERIDQKRGFHAGEKVAGKLCWRCHTEHKGLDYEVMGWRGIGGKNEFDHRWAGWPLDGKHAAVPCAGCHKRQSKFNVPLFIGENGACATCHRKDSPHENSRPELDRCERCHTAQAWTRPKAKLDFDHNDPKQARYPIAGLHAPLACTSCHRKGESNGRKTMPWKVAQSFSDCKGCHLRSEPTSHKGQLFGTKACALCHQVEKKWSDFSFDHGKNTKFSLSGKHATINCYSCHRKGVLTKPQLLCESSGCHAKDDVHKNRFEKIGSCGACHNAIRWKPDNIFDHDGKTQFRLTGKHALVACRNCHRGKTPADFESFPPNIKCMQCHQHEKVHERKFKSEECLRCHRMAGHKQFGESAQNRFHGAESRFPIDGGHRLVACVKCHPKSKTSADNLWKVSPQCGPACHADKLHKGTLGPDCQRCHEGGFWKATDFNHDRDSRYPLVGKHRAVACLACHPKSAYKPTPTDCFSCHKKDDVHQGALGPRCETCHEPGGKSLFHHNTMSRFALDGKHATAACSACHKDKRYKPVETACMACHAKEDVHRGANGTLCERCHNARGWATLRPLHDVGAFRLQGSHDHVPCVRCHGPSLKPLAGTGDLCITCHRKDDIHHNGLSPRCGECHNQWAFAPSTFTHDRVGCFLRGVHRTQPCESCHRGGNYIALSPTCISCHRADALRAATRGDPEHVNRISCTPCHNANYWIPQGVGQGQGIESVCR